MAASAAAGVSADNDAAFRTRLPSAQSAAKAATAAAKAAAAATTDHADSPAAAAASLAVHAAPSPSKKRKRTPFLADDDTDAEQEEAQHSPTEAKKPRHAASPPATTGASTDKLQCLVCFATFTRESILELYYCPSCEMIYTAPGDSVANQRRADKLAMAQEATTSSSVHSSQLDTSTSKPKLGAYETELKRLLDNSGDPFSRFQLTDTISHTDAIAGMRDNSFIGSTFARQSQWLTRLIRSGHFKELSLALPITNEDALRQRTAEAKGGKVRLSANGELTSSAETHVERQLFSLHEFLKILVMSILPTLFDRPRAALDWLELARSTIDITERDGWPVASRYLTDLLNDRVPTAEPINKFDVNILQAVRSSGVAAAASSAAAAGASEQATTAATTAVLRHGDKASLVNQCAPGRCRDWNIGPNGCLSDTSCRCTHLCCWAACPTPQGHQGRDCAHKPADMRLNTPAGQRRSTPASRGQRGSTGASGARQH